MREKAIAIRLSEKEAQSKTGATIKPGTSVEYLQVAEEIEKIRQETKIAREAEYKRLNREFKKSNYAFKYNVSKESIYCALFGYDFMTRKLEISSVKL